MRRIKIKLPFKNKGLLKRRIDLIEMAKILSNHQKFTIIEEEHFPKMSYIVVIVANKKEEHI